MKDAVWFLRISRPGVRVPSIAPENAVKSKDFMAFLFCKSWVHGFCTVSARSVLSMSDDVGCCIALQSVPFFASGEQCQAELCLHFRVGILEQFQKSRHGNGGFACGGYSLRAGGVGLGIEAAFKLLAQLHTGGLLDMSVGVHQHIRTGVSCGPLHRLDVATGDHQLIGGTGMPQPMKDDAGELRVCMNVLMGQIGIDYSKLTKEEQMTLLRVFNKSSMLKHRTKAGMQGKHRR